jgi:hypothetical protein
MAITTVHRLLSSSIGCQMHHAAEWRTMLQACNSFVPSPASGARSTRLCVHANAMAQLNEQSHHIALNPLLLMMMLQEHHRSVAAPH